MVKLEYEGNHLLLNGRVIVLHMDMFLPDRWWERQDDDNRVGIFFDTGKLDIRCK